MPNQVKEFNLHMTQTEVEQVLEALSELPFKKVADLFFKLRNQATEQIQEATVQQEVKPE